MLSCNTFLNPSCRNALPTTDYFGAICEDIIALETCASNVEHTCNNCTGTEYTVWCLCKLYVSECRLCNISSSSFPPTGRINTSLTSSSHNSLSLFTGSLTNPSLVLSPFISPSTIARAVSPVSTIAHAVSPVSTIAHAVSPVSTIAHAVSPVATIAHAVSLVIAGVIPTVCILIISFFSLLVVLFVILYRRNKNKQMSVNHSQRGRAK